MKRPICGHCPDCLERTNRICQPRRGTPLLPGPAPSAAALERHAKRFGPAQVPETAAEFGVSVSVEREHPRRRAGGPSLKTRVRRMVAEGHSVETIAEVEDLTPARARRLVEEIES